MSNECKLAMDILLHREKDILAKAKAKEEEAKRKREEYEKQMAAKAAAQSNGDSNLTQNGPRKRQGSGKTRSQSGEKGRKSCQKSCKE